MGEGGRTERKKGGEKRQRDGKRKAGGAGDRHTETDIQT